MNIKLESGRDINKVYEEFLRESGFKPLPKRRVIGLDLGLVRDYTALAILEEGVIPSLRRSPVTYEAKVWKYIAVRYLERMPKGTTYPNVIDRVREVMRSFEPGQQPIAVVVDATGVGKPVVDLMRAAQIGCQLAPVTITGGVDWSQWGGEFKVPKRDVISNLQLLLQLGILKLAEGMEELETLEAEMEKMEVKLSPSGNEKYACWREGEHDDLVLAVGLAAWWLRCVG